MYIEPPPAGFTMLIFLLNFWGLYLRGGIDSTMDAEDRFLCDDELIAGPSRRSGMEVEGFLGRDGRGQAQWWKDVYTAGDATD
jgi:hypothetical protein